MIHINKNIYSLKNCITYNSSILKIIKKVLGPSSYLVLFQKVDRHIHETKFEIYRVFN